MSYPEHLRALVDAQLEQIRFPSRAAGTAPLEEAMRYSLLAGGKRIRPVLALATAEALAGPPEPVLPFALSLELIHTYSLIHDDLPAMDDDDLRRGRPTCHVRFGEDVAILAGDALYAEAFVHLLDNQRPLPGGRPESVLTAARELASATGVDGMVGGQMLDVAGVTTAPGELELVHRLKTGRLIEAAVIGTLLLAGREEAELRRWRLFAQELGILFQIVDDILDVTGSSEQTGKIPGSDARKGKRTYVTEHGLDGARRLARSSHDRARATLSDCGSQPGSTLAAITDFIFTRTS